MQPNKSSLITQTTDGVFSLTVRLTFTTLIHRKVGIRLIIGKRKDEYILEGKVENDKAILTKATDVEKKKVSAAEVEDEASKKNLWLP